MTKRVKKLDDFESVDEFLHTKDTIHERDS